MTKQLTDVLDGVFDHGRSLQAEAESVHSQVLGQSHGLQHLRSEHATVANLLKCSVSISGTSYITIFCGSYLYKLFQALVVAEELHTRLCVGVVSVSSVNREQCAARIVCLLRWLEFETKRFVSMGICINVCKSIGVYSLSQSHLVEEGLEEFHQTTEGQAVIGNNTCDC